MNILDLSKRAGLVSFVIDLFCSGLGFLNSSNTFAFQMSISIQQILQRSSILFICFFLQCSHNLTGKYVALFNSSVFIWVESIMANVGLWGFLRGL